MKHYKAWKNPCLIGITILAVIGVLIGFGLVDNGEFMKGCITISICYLWIGCFSYANGIMTPS